MILESLQLMEKAYWRFWTNDPKVQIRRAKEQWRKDSTHVQIVGKAVVSFVLFRVASWTGHRPSTNSDEATQDMDRTSMSPQVDVKNGQF